MTCVVTSRRVASSVANSNRNLYHRSANGDDSDSGRFVRCARTHGLQQAYGLYRA